MTRRLLLLGAGPAQRQVLGALARQRIAGAEVLLVAQHDHAVLQPQLWDVVAGRRAAEHARLPLAPLAAAAGCAFVEAAVLHWDAAARRVQLAGGAVADYDLLSLDWPAAVDRDAIPGAREHALALHPLPPFLRLQAELQALAARRVLDIVVVGGGRDAVALALALAQALGGSSGRDERARIALVTGGPLPLQGQGERAMQRAAQQLRRQRITVLREACTAIDAQAVHLANGARLACDAALVAEPALPPPWLAASGLALDAQGRPALRPTLQSSSHDEVFIAAEFGAGAALALNLRRHAGGGALQAWQARPRWRAWLTPWAGT